MQRAVAHIPNPMAGWIDLGVDCPADGGHHSNGAASNRGQPHPAAEREHDALNLGVTGVRDDPTRAFLSALAALSLERRDFLGRLQRYRIDQEAFLTTVEDP